MNLPKSILRPMLATLVDRAFDDPEWIFEIKYDGYRLLALLEERSVTLYSRNTIDLTRRYPTIAKALAKTKKRTLLDGELVALNKDGISRFQLLQHASERPASLYYYVFDLLLLDGKDMRDTPLLQRKKLLKKALPKKGVVRYSEHISCNGKKFFNVASRQGLEGVIGKRAQSLYFSGTRTREWLKIKCMHEQEAVVVGYTRPKGSREYFGSLVLAINERGAWKYVGHSGGGFDTESLRMLYMTLSKLHGPKPFAEKIARESDVTWVKPKLVCEVRFTEWTEGDQMRHPIFLGLRDDKSPKEVVRERPK